MIIEKNNLVGMTLSGGAGISFDCKRNLVIDLRKTGEWSRVGNNDLFGSVIIKRTAEENPYLSMGSIRAGNCLRLTFKPNILRRVMNEYKKAGYQIIREE